jgi:hypothetical protein
VTLEVGDATEDFKCDGHTFLSVRPLTKKSVHGVDIVEGKEASVLVIEWLKGNL